MFIRYYVELPMTFAEAEGALLRDPEALLGQLVDGARDRGESLLAEVGLSNGAPRLDSHLVELRDPVRFDSKTALPMSWQSTDPDAPFPHFEADIELAPLGASVTQLAISARYTPPQGARGRAMDRVVLHRVAEATVKDFLDRVGRALVEATAT